MSDEIPDRTSVAGDAPAPVPVTADPAEVVVPPATPASDAVAHRVVYVDTPAAPRARGNRVVGVLLALAGTVVFAAVYALVAGLLYLVAGGPPFGPRFTQFAGSAAYWAPILVFVLAFILLVVVLNRAGWTAHVFGSLLLGFVVYFASIGLLLLVGNVVTRQDVTFAQIALMPQIIGAALIAREVAIWLGLAIAARGRRVRARNREARERFDREATEKHATYQGPAAAAPAK